MCFDTLTRRLAHQPTIAQLKHYRNLSHASKFLVVANEQKKVAVAGFLAMGQSLVADRTVTSVIKCSLWLADNF